MSSRKETRGLYSLLDIVAEEYGPIFEANNHLHAARMRQELCKRSNVSIGDFAIMHLGEISNQGVIQAVLPRMLSSEETGEMIFSGFPKFSDEETENIEVGEK